MKTSTLRRLLPLVCLFAITSEGGGNPLPQPPIEFSLGLQGTFNADWEGVSARTYFMVFSMDLEVWHYAPFIDFGDGGHHRGIESDADKFFVRLHHIDYPGINSLDDAVNADFDGDALPNAYEVFHGLTLGPLSAEPEAIFLQLIAGQPAAPAVFELHTPLQ